MTHFTCYFRLVLTFGPIVNLDTCLSRCEHGDIKAFHVKRVFS